MKYFFFILLAAAIFLAVSPIDAAMRQLAGPRQASDTPLKVKSKPQASARGCSGSGKAVLKVTFDKSGQITGVTAISSSGCGPFDRDAVRAAKKITFEPAVKNGVPVTVIRSVEYVYAIY